eukprot:CAMPEP_0115011066 /NCGR_PEP_ID=MMETSP0216-20121206/23749_1 /TAXON_ID=223996 /ORGANISM="Protocruzia adherens, Strain Boccale" /LENGTH=230 /DNA_ID=CAMNT_0002379519 /DNA_START=36 /DNA_END=728 /DNA_ORIENTATION=-
MSIFEKEGANYIRHDRDGAIHRPHMTQNGNPYLSFLQGGANSEQGSTKYLVRAIAGGLVGAMGGLANTAYNNTIKGFKGQKLVALMEKQPLLGSQTFRFLATTLPRPMAAGAFGALALGTWWEKTRDGTSSLLTDMAVTGAVFGGFGYSLLSTQTRYFWGAALYGALGAILVVGRVYFENNSIQGRGGPIPYEFRFDMDDAKRTQQEFEDLRTEKYLASKRYNPNNKYVS